MRYSPHEDRFRERIHKTEVNRVLYKLVEDGILTKDVPAAGNQKPQFYATAEQLRRIPELLHSDPKHTIPVVGSALVVATPPLSAQATHTGSSLRTGATSGEEFQKYQTIAQWLASLEFSSADALKYASVFKNEGLDSVSDLSMVEDEEALLEMGIKKFHAKKMRKWLAARKVCD